MYEKDLPDGADKDLLRKKKYETKTGGTYFKYEIDADANSKANTILKMAKKRAQIDAVLTVASLSEIFTQDFDDLPPEETPSTKPVVDKVKNDIKESVEFVCSECGAEVSAKVANYSLDKFGKILCYDCQKKG